MMRLVLGIMMMALVAACDSTADLADAPVPLGDFRLEHNIVVAPKVQRSPVSRKATEDELTQAVRTAIAERFGPERYNGASRYHFGISVDGYALAPPGVPLVLAPKSALILNVTVWDDAAGKKLNETPQQIVVLESLGADTIIGTGFTMTAEQQLTELSQNAAKAIERFLVREQAENGWFTPDETVDVSSLDVIVAN